MLLQSNSDLINALEDREKWGDIPNLLSDIHTVDDFNQTPLHLSALKGVPMNTVKLIFDANPAAAYEEDFFGRTPVFCFAENCTEEAYFYFLEKVPDCFYNYFKGCSALHYFIRQHRSVRLVRYLIDIDCHAVHAVNRDGDTPLHLFFATWYKPLKEFLSALPGEVSPKELMGMHIVNMGKEFSIRYVYKMSCLLLRTYYKEGNNSECSILPLSIQNISCPWIWCDFFLLLHPEQNNLALSKNCLPLTLVTQVSKQSCYQKLFKCCKCNSGSKAISKLWRDSNVFCCGKCHDPTKRINATESTFISYAEEMAGDLTFIYKLIRENPTTYANVAIKNMKPKDEGSGSRRKRRLSRRFSAKLSKLIKGIDRMSFTKGSSGIGTLLQI